VPRGRLVETVTQGRKADLDLSPASER
jgi:hypothetical protein